MATDFTPVSSLIGGGLIGLGAVVLMTGAGRIAGISGIASGLVARLPDGDAAWRLAFILGLIGGAGITALWVGGAPAGPPVPLGMTLAAGALVGAGTVLGNGCTSGHGVCGLARLSGRSVVATLTFMAAGMVAVALVRHLAGVGG